MSQTIAKNQGHQSGSLVETGGQTQLILLFSLLMQ